MELSHVLDISGNVRQIKPAFGHCEFLLSCSHVWLF